MNCAMKSQYLSFRMRALEAMPLDGNQIENWKGQFRGIE